MTPENHFLLVVKAILVSIKAIKPNTALDRKSWLSYYHDGYSPIKAVKEDYDGYKLPFVRYSKVLEIIKQLEK